MNQPEVVNNEKVFERDMNHYTVIDNDDAKKYLSNDELVVLENIRLKITAGRCRDDKPLRNFVIVSDKYQDLYDITWKLMEKELKFLGINQLPSKSALFLSKDQSDMIIDMIHRSEVKLIDPNKKFSKNQLGYNVESVFHPDIIRQVITGHFVDAYAELIKINERTHTRMSHDRMVDESIKRVLKLFFYSHSIRVAVDIVKYPKDDVPLRIDILLSEKKHDQVYGFVGYEESSLMRTRDRITDKLEVVVMIRGIREKRLLKVTDPELFGKSPLQYGDPVRVANLVNPNQFNP
ncbi:hypothetical protein [Yersinia phage vB_Yru_GN1]|uniref:Uncharacterized protein n=1 Tax=Yersinia phage vB_Yru_GN1 TaxID=3074381 RepID=A0AA86MA66_9CAUD|nr:hypothetical protein [Yersinia phage vB_Yru_GN1]